MKNFILVISVLFFTSTASASFILAPGFGYMKTGSKNDATDTETTTTYLNLKFAYDMEGWALGVAYDSFSSDDGSTETTVTGTGLYVGYLWSSWNVGLEYYLTSSYDSGSTTYEGSGMGFNFGYMIDAGGWKLGPQIVYRSHTFTEDSNGNAVPGGDLTITHLNPQFQAWFMF